MQKKSAKAKNKQTASAAREPVFDGSELGVGRGMIYEPHIMHDPLIPFIFHTDVRRGGEKFHPNWHTNIEMLLCLTGRGTVNLESVEIVFKPGDVVVINSNVLHSIYTDSMIEYDCLIVDRDFCRSNGIDTDNVVFQEKMRDESLNQLFCAVKQVFLPKTALNYRAAKIRCAVLMLLICLSEKYTLTERNNVSAMRMSGGTERVKRAMVYIRQNMRQALSLEEISAAVGISKYYFTREFRRVTGQTVFEYINVVRCKEAKRLIAEGMTVSEAARTCGFENLSYFSRTYKKCIGELPSARGN